MSGRRYFGTDGIRGQVGEWPITADFMLKLGGAVGRILCLDGHHKKVFIGRDTRTSGQMLASALAAGFATAGVDVIDVGVLPTPAVAFLTRSLKADAGVVISASHNPAKDNGVKFFDKSGMKFPDEIELAIEHELEKTVQPTSTIVGQTQTMTDAQGRYIEFCKGVLPMGQDLRGIKVVVDAAHGAAYDVAPRLLKELGADVIEIGCAPNGENINADVGATAPHALQQKVLASKAELGIAIDGDGDRLIMVDDCGEVVDGDEILYILAKAYEATGQLTGGVVGTLMSNCGLVEALSAQNIAFVRAKVGDRYVLEKMVEQNWCLGGETSGHLICLDKTTTGDALIAAVRVLALLVAEQTTLHQLKQGMQKWPQVMINVPVKKAAKTVVEDTTVQACLSRLTQQLGDAGRIVLRPSGTEPVVRVMVEAKSRQAAEQHANTLAMLVSQVKVTECE